MEYEINQNETYFDYISDYDENEIETINSNNQINDSNVLTSLDDDKNNEKNNNNHNRFTQRHISNKFKLLDEAFNQADKYIQSNKKINEYNFSLENIKINRNKNSIDQDPLYDDTMDYKDTKWVETNLRNKNEISDAIISCPCCFQIVCMNCKSKNNKFISKDGYYSIKSENNDILCTECNTKVGFIDNNNIYHYTDVLTSHA